MEGRERLIITAASAAYGPALLALLGSLDSNWPSHPEVLVYDIGLDAVTLAALRDVAIEVRAVPEFCGHWREHYTWKLWCLNDTPARQVLWMDAAVVVLQPLDETFEAIAKLGYFFTTNYEMLDWEASDEACTGCGVDSTFRYGKATIAGTVMGFDRVGHCAKLIAEALRVAMNEKSIAASSVAHRHDQAILSLLAYRYLGGFVLSDSQIYLGTLSPKQVSAQKVWAHRKTLAPGDLVGLRRRMGRRDGAYEIVSPPSILKARAQAALYRMFWHFGQGNHAMAGEQLRFALACDPELVEEPFLLAQAAVEYREQGYKHLAAIDASRLVAWALRALEQAHGRGVRRSIEACVQYLNAVRHANRGEVSRTRAAACYALRKRPQFWFGRMALMRRLVRMIVFAR